MTGRLAAFIFSIGALSSGCGNPLFQTNFDSDPAAAPPLRSPPGDPAGDEVFSPVGADGTTAATVLGARFGLDGRSLFLRAYGQRFVWFVGREGSADSIGHMAYWRGVVDFGAGPVLEIGFGDAHAVPILTFRLTRGRVLVKRAGDFVDIGRYERRAIQTVLLQLDKRTRTWSLGIDNETVAVEDVSLRDEPLPAGVSVDLARPQLSFSFVTGPGGNPYVIDDALITEYCRPPTSDDDGACDE